MSSSSVTDSEAEASSASSTPVREVEPLRTPSREPFPPNEFYEPISPILSEAGDELFTAVRIMPRTVSSSTIHGEDDDIEEEENDNDNENENENLENLEAEKLAQEKLKETIQNALKRKLEAPEADLEKDAISLRNGIPLNTKTNLKISVTRVQMTASWKWTNNENEDKCGICRGGFEGTCPTCRLPGDGCPLAVGECKHSFHLHCISRWGDQNSKTSCPLCRNEWRYIETPVYT